MLRPNYYYVKCIISVYLPGKISRYPAYLKMICTIVLSKIIRFFGVIIRR